MRYASVLPPHGVFPLGGYVDHIDQREEHSEAGNELAGGATITIVAEKTALVTTYGGLYNDNNIRVVKIRGKSGWYLASSFSRA